MGKKAKKEGTKGKRARPEPLAEATQRPPKKQRGGHRVVLRQQNGGTWVALPVGDDRERHVPGGQCRLLLTN